MALKNEVGNTYGYLTVVERAENDNENRAQWWCECKCGNRVKVRGKSLRRGNTKSCGCYQKERAIQSNMDRVGSLVGQRFGKLTVISEAGFVSKASGRRARLYNCQCDCGNICQIQHQYLSSGDTTSCGCIRSKGEFTISQLLKEHNILFKQEYMFDDLNDIYPLRFDFAIFDGQNLIGLIEYQGEQHWTKSNGFYNEDIIRHDKMKKEYCEKHNIPLICIYYEKNQQLTYKDLHLEQMGVNT